MKRDQQRLRRRLHDGHLPWVLSRQEMIRIIILVTTVARVSRVELSRQEVVILNIIIITNITRVTPGGMATG